MFAGYMKRKAAANSFLDLSQKNKNPASPRILPSIPAGVFSSSYISACEVAKHLLRIGFFLLVGIVDIVNWRCNVDSYIRFLFIANSNVFSRVI